MKVSVFMPTKDRPQWVRRAVHSVLSQTYQDWELVVLDVGERSVEDVVQKDERIRYHRGVAEGPARDFQKALDLTTGELVTPLADDDRLPRRALETAVENLDGKEWLNGRTVLVDESGEPVAFRGGTFAHLEDTKAGRYMLGGGVYWRKTLTDRIGGFNSDFDGAADFDLYRRFLDSSDPARVQDTLYIHVVHPLQDTQVNQNRQADATRRIAAR